MTISNCHFEPPYNEKYAADAVITVDGILDIYISIYRYQDPNTGRIALEVEWPELVVIEDDYNRRCVDGEILERYIDWLR